MNDAKPWGEKTFDAEWDDGSQYDRTLATCRQRDELVEVVRELVKHLDESCHNDSHCSRSEECDELEPGEECGNHDVCPSCECGVDRWQASATKARAVLAKWGAL